MRKSLIFVGVAVVALIAIAVAGGHWGYTARSRVSEVILSMSPLRTAVTNRCVSGTLTTGLTQTSLGFPELYKPGPHVQSIRVHVESPQRARIIATLEDIRSDTRPFWMAPEISAGAILELEVRCQNRIAETVVGAATTVPDKHLPSSHHRPRSRPP